MTTIEIQLLVNKVTNKSNIKLKDEDYKEEALYRTQDYLKDMLVEALTLDSDAVLLKIEKEASYTADIIKEDVIQVAKNIKMHIVASDVDYIMRNYDTTKSNFPNDLWISIIENMLYELKK